MSNKRLYVTRNNLVETSDKCPHETEVGSQFYLETDYSEKYNHCVLCAIDAWNGSMPHDEIALCLGVPRMQVCQLEKRVLEKLKKRINYRNKPIKALKLIDSCIINVKGLSSKYETECVKEIAFRMGCDFDVELPVEVVFKSKEIVLDGKLGKAVYESPYRPNNKHIHKITFNTSVIKNKKDFIETLTHEMFHAVQVENSKTLSDKMCEAVTTEYGKDYYREYLAICRDFKKKKLIGKRR